MSVAEADSRTRFGAGPGGEGWRVRIPPRWPRGWLGAALWSWALIAPLSACRIGAQAPGADPAQFLAAPGPVVAIVGSREIHRGEVVARLLERYYGSKALLGVVRLTLFELEATRLGLVVDEEEVAAAVAEQLDGVDSGLDESLARVGLTRDDLRSELARETYHSLLIERIVRAQRRIGERQIQAHYAKTYAQTRVRVRHIAFPFAGVSGRSSGPTAAAVSAARGRAERAIARLRAGDSFSRLAEELSGNRQTSARGGDLGWIDENSIADEEVTRAVLGLETAEVSEPVREGDYGFHVFRVDRREPARPLDAVRDFVRRELREAPVTPEEIERVEEILRERYAVTVLAENLGSLPALGARSSEPQTFPPPALPAAGESRPTGSRPAEPPGARAARSRHAVPSGGAPSGPGEGPAATENPGGGGGES